MISWSDWNSRRFSTSGSPLVSAGTAVKPAGSSGFSRARPGSTAAAAIGVSRGASGMRSSRESAMPRGRISGRACEVSANSARHSTKCSIACSRLPDRNSSRIDSTRAPMSVRTSRRPAVAALAREASWRTRANSLALSTTASASSTPPLASASSAATTTLAARISCQAPHSAGSRGETDSRWRFRRPALRHGCDARLIVEDRREVLGVVPEVHASNPAQLCHSRPAG